MSIIRASVTDQRLKITEAPVIASGGQNETSIVFTFCEKWDGLVKTAIFYRDEEEVYYCVLDAENTCVVPWEVCYESGTFYIGVFGEKDTVRRTSTTARYKVKRGALTDGLYPSNPTLDVYNQIVDMVKDVQDKVETFEETDPTVPAWAKAAKKPTYTAAEVGALSADALPGAVNNALAQAKANGEFDGAPGKDGVDGKDGYTPVKGKDYFDGKDGQDGNPGKNGADGISPTVKVSKSGKVTTITITDANGTHKATINDGEDGAEGGSNTLIVTVDEGIASDSSHDVAEHIAAGGSVKLLYQQQYMNFLSVDEQGGIEAIFGNVDYYGIAHVVTINELGDVREYAHSIPNDDHVNSLIETKLDGFEGGVSIHFGAEAPTDENVSLWVDTDEEGGSGGGSGHAPNSVWLEEERITIMENVETGAECRYMVWLPFRLDDSYGVTLVCDGVTYTPEMRYYDDEGCMYAGGVNDANGSFYASVTFYADDYLVDDNGNNGVVVGTAKPTTVSVYVTKETLQTNCDLWVKTTNVNSENGYSESQLVQGDYVAVKEKIAKGLPVCAYVQEYNTEAFDGDPVRRTTTQEIVPVLYETMGEPDNPDFVEYLGICGCYTSYLQVYQDGTVEHF